MLKMGYRHSQEDHTHFYKNSANVREAILIIYVDIIVTYDDNEENELSRKKLIT